MMAAEFKFMARTAGYTFLDYIWNSDIMKELSTLLTTEFIEIYTANWKNHVLRIPHSNPIQIPHY
jgi:hypothetical protein